MMFRRNSLGRERWIIGNDMDTASARTAWNPWPVGIIAFFVLFILATVGFVVFSVGQRADLVVEDYYQKELRYQEQMDREERTLAGGLAPTVRHDLATDALTITLPVQHVGVRVQGHIRLYRPSAAAMDREIELQPDAAGRQTVDAAGLADGLWQVQVEWSIGEAQFAAEQRVVIDRKSDPP